MKKLIWKKTTDGCTTESACGLRGTVDSHIFGAWFAGADSLNGTREWFTFGSRSAAKAWVEHQLTGWEQRLDRLIARRTARAKATT